MGVLITSAVSLLIAYLEDLGGLIGAVRTPNLKP